MEASMDGSKELTEALLCPITCQLLRDPVIAPDGYTYEHAAIKEWLEQKGTSPFTREAMSVAELKPNRKVLDLLDRLERRSGHLSNTAANGFHGTDCAPSAPPAPSCSQPDMSSMNSIPSAPPAPMVRSEIIISSGAQAASLSTVRLEAFTALDELSDLVTAATDSFQPPQIVVLGTESHGKSTILQRLAGLPIFPRDRTLCTRVPVRVRFRRGPLQCIQMWEQGIDPSTGQSQAEAQDLLEHASCVAGTLVLEQVRDMMTQIMRRLNEQRGQCGVSLEHEIVVQLRGPTYPDLDLVDLPGLVEMAHAGEDANMPEKSRELTQRYLRQHGEHSMFIVALDCRNAMHTMSAVRLLKEHGALTKTLGVLTKCDAFVPYDADSDDSDSEGAGQTRSTNLSSSQTAVGAGLTELLSPETNPNYVETGYGWVLLSSKGLPRYNKPSSGSTTSAIINASHLLNRLGKCQAKEAAFFEKNGVSMSNNAGIAALCRRVIRCHEDYIHRHWVPLALHVLSVASHDVRDEISSLGMPFTVEDAAPDGQVDSLPSELLDHVANSEVMAGLVRSRLVEMLIEPKDGLLAISRAWLDDILSPVMRGLESATASGHVNAQDNIGVQNIMTAIDHALQQFRLASTSESDHAYSQDTGVASGAGPVHLHPIAAALKEYLRTDQSELRIGRFKASVDAVASRVGHLLKDWTRHCAAVVDVVRPMIEKTGFSKVDGVALTSADGVDVTISLASESEPTVEIPHVRQTLSTTLAAQLMRRQLQRRPFLLGSVIKPMFDASRHELDDTLNAPEEIVDEALMQACDAEKLWVDEHCSARKAVVQKLVQIKHATDRLRALLPPDIAAARAMSHSALTQRRSVSLQPLTAEEFRQMLQKVELDVDVQAKISSVYEGTCGARLDLSLSNISDEGVTVLAQALESNACVQSLNLAGNCFSAVGAAALAQALEFNTSLQKLDLSGNSVGAEGAAALARALEFNTCLTGLSLEWNTIGDDGANALASALDSNRTLTLLNVMSNGLSAEAKRRLLKLERRRKGLTLLS